MTMINMLILVDWFKNDARDIDIKEPAPRFDRVRIALDRENQSREENVLYVCKAGSAAGSGVLCFCEDSSFFVPAERESEVYNAVFEVVNFYNSIFETVEKMLLKNLHYQEAYDVLSTGLWHNVYVIDNISRVPYSSVKFTVPEHSRADAEYMELNRFVPPDVLKEIEANQVIDYLSHKPQRHKLPLSGREAVHINIFCEGRSVGYMLCPEAINPLSPGEISYLEIFNSYVERWYNVNQDSRLSSYENAYNWILEGVLGEDYLQNALSRVKWKPGEKVLVCIDPPYTSEYSLNFAFDWVKVAYKNHFPFVHHGKICIVYPYNEAEHRSLVYELTRLSKQINSCIGVSCGFFDITELENAYHQALVAAEFCKNQDKDVVFCADCWGAYIRRIVRDNSAFRMCPRELSRIKWYDQSHSTDYYTTLYQYLLCERRQGETAARLGIHRNTLGQRLDFIKNLTDLDLNDPRKRMELLSAFFISEDLFEKI